MTIIVIEFLTRFASDVEEEWFLGKILKLHLRIHITLLNSASRGYWARGMKRNGSALGWHTYTEAGILTRGPEFESRIIKIIDFSDF